MNIEASTAKGITPCFFVIEPVVKKHFFYHLFDCIYIFVLRTKRGKKQWKDFSLSMFLKLQSTLIPAAFSGGRSAQKVRVTTKQRNESAK